MLKILTALAMSAAAGLTLTAATMPSQPPAPRFDILATDATGNQFVAGSGDDCAAAWIDAVLPSDWREIICVEAESEQPRQKSYRDSPAFP